MICCCRVGMIATAIDSQVGPSRHSLPCQPRPSHPTTCDLSLDYAARTSSPSSPSSARSRGSSIQSSHASPKPLLPQHESVSSAHVSAATHSTWRGPSCCRPDRRQSSSTCPYSCRLRGVCAAHRAWAHCRRRCCCSLHAHRRCWYQRQLPDCRPAADAWSEEEEARMNRVAVSGEAIAAPYKPVRRPYSRLVVVVAVVAAKCGSSSRVCCHVVYASSLVQTCCSHRLCEFAPCRDVPLLHVHGWYSLSWHLHDSSY